MQDEFELDMQFGRGMRGLGCTLVGLGSCSMQDEFELNVLFCRV